MSELSRLPQEDASFDAGVASLVLCSVPDPRRSLAGLRRLISQGQLRFFEHVRSAGPLIGAFQDPVTPAWSRAGGGCHLNRDLAAGIAAAGFEIERLDRFTCRPLQFASAQAHILGTARRPR